MTRAAIQKIAARAGVVMVIAIGGLFVNAVPVHAQDYAAIVALPDRTDADRQTDKRRNPVALLTFTGPRTGGVVLDMGADAGYSTELMARAVGPTGKVYGQNDAESEKFRARMANPAMHNVEAVVRPFDDPVPPAVHDLDLVTFYFAYHDTTYMAVDRGKMDKALFAALKPGGFLSLPTIQLCLKTAPRLERPITALPKQPCGPRLKQPVSNSLPVPISYATRKMPAPPSCSTIPRRWTNLS